MKSLAIYHENLTGSGGVVTFTKTLIKELSNHYKITLIYNEINQSIKQELSQFATIIHKTESNKTKQYNYLIYASPFSSICNILAYKKIDIIHADFSKIKRQYQKKSDITHIVAVSNNNKNAIERITDCTVDSVIPNIPDLSIKSYTKRKNEVLTLISVTRLCMTKGIDRMIKLATYLNQTKTPFKWDVYGRKDTPYAREVVKSFPENLEYKGYEPKPHKLIAEADYLVQLSDSEGFSYSILEALQQRTPVITTKYPSAKEQVKHGVNGWILDFKLRNWRCILQDKLKMTNFEPVSTVTDWVDFLENG